MRCWPLAIVIVLTLAGAAVAAERFPPPEFTNHVLPTTAVPPGHSVLFDVIYLAALAVALALAAMFVHVLRSRMAIVLLMVASLAYFGWFYGGCLCPVGAVQNVAQALGQGAIVPVLVVAVFLLPLIVALFVGRAFCGGVCPLGAIQDLVVLHPLRVPSWLDGALGLLRYAYLGLAVLAAATGSAYLICEYDPFLGLFRLAGPLTMVIAGLSLLAMGTFLARPYCRWLCPYGLMLSWASRFSQRRVKIAPTQCVKCRLCEDSCPVGAIQTPNDDHPIPRHQGRGVLAAMLVLLPVLIAGGAAAGRVMAPTLARLDATVRVAERLDAEASGAATGTTEAGDAFRATGRPVKELQTAAAALREKFLLGSTLFGAFMGLAIGGRLVGLCRRKTRTGYEADKASCLACGRCLKYCPVGRTAPAAPDGGDAP
ncbi:MAG: 4Fe-4S binding protein [Planctomycetaceae bacterium]|nr:4Fe-4S binding protein [Planctomycetaceae bacterium]